MKMGYVFVVNSVGLRLENRSYTYLYMVISVIRNFRITAHFLQLYLCTIREHWIGHVSKKIDFVYMISLFSIFKHSTLFKDMSEF